MGMNLVLDLLSSSFNNIILSYLDPFFRTTFCQLKMLDAL